MNFSCNILLCLMFNAPLYKQCFSCPLATKIKFKILFSLVWKLKLPGLHLTGFVLPLKFF